MEILLLKKLLLLDFVDLISEHTFLDVISITLELLWFNIQPKAKIQNKNDVITIQGKGMISASIESELIL